MKHDLSTNKTLLILTMCLLFAYGCSSSATGPDNQGVIDESGVKAELGDQTVLIPGHIRIKGICVFLLIRISQSAFNDVPGNKDCLISQFCLHSALIDHTLIIRACCGGGAPIGKQKAHHEYQKGFICR